MSKNDKAAKIVAPIALIGPLEQKYLDVALDKRAQKPHPNFVAKASATNIAAVHRIQAATIRISQAAKPGTKPSTLCLLIASTLTDDVFTYVTFWKSLLSDCAFAVHMDLVRMERAVAPDVMAASLQGMDDPKIALSDIPGVDVGDAAHNEAPHEVQEVATIADNENDAYEAINDLQSWVSLAFAQFDADSRDFWNLDGGVPFAQYGEDRDYKPVLDFDEYRELQNERWKAKQRKVPQSNDAMALMMQTAT